MSTHSNHTLTRRQILEAATLLLVVGTTFGYLGETMGVTNMFNTLFNTAHDL